ncbi:MAG: decarboxylating 6-phosphogluconate dehydrogenase [Gammaproteobacteria bacterium]|jgi:6-phosphogluconate dehydrogenase
MHLGIIGLGRMGANMARRLRRADIEVTAFNRTESVTQELAGETGLTAAASIEELVAALPSPKIVWLMLPSGDITEQHVEQVSELLSEGDLLVDGANSWYKDSMRRAQLVNPKGIGYVDAGVSGGVWGLENGYALMVGGEERYVELIEPALKVLAPGPDKGWHHCGPVGSGHFVKMVHNGIEYGMMQAFAEGFALMKSREDFDMDMAAIAEMWRHGSVVRSWLLDLTADFLKEDQQLEGIEPHVADSGEGRWTAIEGIEQGVPTPVMSLATMMRFSSQGKGDYGNRLLAMMRKGFGGHAVTTKD